MYAEAVIASRQRRLEAQFAATLPPEGLIRYPVPACHAMKADLDRIWDPEEQHQTRPFSQEEEGFVVNEQLLSKVDYRYAAERYLYINKAGQQLASLFPLWASQELLLGALARQEEQRWRTRHPDGLLANVIKGRQLGCSTWVQSLLAHRVLTHGQVRALIASDVPQNSGSEGLFGMLELMVEQWPWWLKPKERFHTKNKHIMWENGSRVIVESGKSMKGGLLEEGGEKGQLGRSKTFSAAHLSEITTWERPDQINASLLPAMPSTPRTLCVRESTAMGRNNYWHQEWNLAAAGEDPRFFNIFIPWYAESSQYWLPYPPEWIPSDDTLHFARRAQQEGPKYMGRPVILSKEQLYWYELQKRAAIKREVLYTFLSEYPAEPEEAFQNSGRSIFSIETLTRIQHQARPLADLWRVAPRAELLADREASIQEFQQSQAELLQSRADQRTRAENRVVGEGTPQTIREETPTFTEIAPDPTTMQTAQTAQTARTMEES